MNQQAKFQSEERHSNCSINLTKSSEGLKIHVSKTITLDGSLNYSNSVSSTSLLAVIEQLESVILNAQTIFLHELKQKCQERSGPLESQEMRTLQTKLFKHCINLLDLSQ